MSVGKTILSSIAGGAAGALSGAALFGIPTYFSKGTGFLGPESNLALLAAAIGFLVGMIPGTVIGLVVGLLKPRLLIGAIVGVGVGFLISPILLATGANPQLDTGLFSFALAGIPIGGVIGLLVAGINRRRSPTLPKKPLDRSTGRVFPKLTD